MSAKRWQEVAAYSMQRAVFLERNKGCMAPGCRKLAEDVHHTRGRAGGLLLLESSWVGLCRGCHRRVTDSPKWARSVGLLCAVGEWGLARQGSARRGAAGPGVARDMGEVRVSDGGTGGPGGRLGPPIPAPMTARATKEKTE
jgi:hypothetical protein